MFPPRRFFLYKILGQWPSNRFDFSEPGGPGFESRHLSRISVQEMLAEPREVSSDLDPSLSQISGLGSAVSSHAQRGSGPTILMHFRLMRKHLVLYKSLFSENCSII